MIFAAAFIITETGFYRSVRPPFNYTGADGSTCAQCHTNLNNGGGTVAAPGLPVGTFNAGEAYDFGIEVSHPETRGRWGFSIAARDANNQPVGTFSSSNPHAELNGTELSHFMAVFQTGTAYTYENLRWTAPVNPTTAQQNVTFYYMANAANGDLGQSGDFIYSGTSAAVMLPPVNQSPVVTVTSPGNNSILAAGSPATLNANASDPDGTIRKVEFYDHGVKFLTDSVAPYGMISNNEIEPGEYVLTARAFDNEGDSTVSDTVRITVTGCTPAGFATGKGYLDIPGSQVADMLNHASYPGNPGIVAQLNGLEYSNVGNNYGGRLSGYICAPMTGNYTFYIAGDDQAGLFLSSNQDSANKILIAYTATATGFREWLRFPTQKSASIKLVRGARYYFEVLHKQSAAANHVSVGWMMPDGRQEGPIPGNRLSPEENNATLLTQLSFRQAMQERTNVASPLSVSVAPNPSANRFVISIKSGNDARINVVLTDASGRIIEKRTSLPVNATIQMGDRLRPGIYFLEIIQGNHKERLKLIRI